MRDFVRFGVILHHMATVAGWLFGLVLLAFPQERSIVGFVLLLIWAFWQTVAVLGLFARWLLGRLDEKQEKMQRTADKLCASLGERRAKGVFAAVLAAMMAFKLVLPAGLNRI